MPDFLLEIGCEEIPARMLRGAEASLGRQVAELLLRERLIFQPSAPRALPGTGGGTLSTPRRLSVIENGVARYQADVEDQVHGPAVKVAFKDGQLTAAAEAFAKKVGIDVAKLERVNTPKGEYLSARVVRKGRKAGEILSEMLPKEIASLYWPKNMYWRPGAPERFVRPIRWIVAMLDGEVIPLEFAGVKAGNTTRGHRFFSDEVNISKPSDYEKALERAKVIVGRTKREARIRQALDAVTRAVAGARWRENEELLDAVVNLTEWPSVILGNFDKEFLKLPEEVLVTVMRDHQKYFAVEDANGKLLPHFLAVLNTEGDPDGLIRHGNERVLRARFNDARFFWQTDQKVPLRKRVDLLKNVTFQKDLGSYFEKTERVEKLAGKLAEELVDTMNLDVEAVAEAAWHSKADLTTELVKEFTELQGIVGGLYARHQGLSATIADAIYDHYKPESMEDAVPRTLEGAVLSIADKLDTIVGMFALGFEPSGSKDPFALRRQANAIVRIIAEHKLHLRFIHLFRMTRAVYEHKSFKTTGVLTGYEVPMQAFFRERLEFYLREARGFAYDVVKAVLAAGSDKVVDAIARAEAVAAVRASADFEAISVSFKRIKNILRQAKEKNPASEIPAEPNAALLQEDAERALMQLAVQVGADTKRLSAAEKYHEALAEISKLRPALDAFFDKVMVMVEDPKIRANRLALLQKLLLDFSSIADFSEIVPEGKTA